ncbi:hypothetical protein [Sneathiella limimaris]|uniref:hypothetical protein n=1 Tax=Sneathiella limimaris TaxID=1964213 RepID=UPI00146CE5FF|nr:hypothetical protein [Sneathiella limimaris]
MGQKLSPATQKWVPWIKFIIPLGFSLLGLLIWMNWRGVEGVVGFIACFLIGSVIGNYYFKRWATLDHIKDDLRHRVDTE